jgi:hypothetical protein
MVPAIVVSLFVHDDNVAQTRGLPVPIAPATQPAST